MSARSPNPFLVVALLISVFVHLFVVDRAIDLTFKWRLFSTAAGDEFFQIKELDIRRMPEIPKERPQWRPQDIISLGPAKEEVIAKRETEDKVVLLESEKFISSDATEETILRSIEKAIETEPEPITKPGEVAPAPGPAVEATVAQEVLAMDEALLKKEIPPYRPRISAQVKRGTAQSDFVFFTEAGPSAGPSPRAIGMGPAAELPAPGTPGEKKGMAKLAMADETVGIPGVIAPPPPPVLKQDIETTDLVDIVRENYEKIQKYPPLDDLLTVQLFTYHRPGETKGYFKLVVEPRKDKKDFRVVPKDIIFVVDSSKSITQAKLDAYSQGVKLSLQAVSPRDRFNVVEFKDFTRKLAQEDVATATPEMIAKADAFLSELVSEGGTNVYRSLTELVTPNPAPGRPRIVFLVSDGRPTVGIRQESEIINEVTRLNNLRASVFTFAGGEKINAPLLDLLSYRNRGARTFERDQRKIPESLLAFYQEFSSPILLNPRFNFGSVESSEVYPKILPDLYLKGKLEIFGRFGEEPEFSMQLLGEADGRTKEYVLQQPLSGQDTGDESVARMWAFRKIYDLVGKMVQEGGSQAILSEIQKLSADYKVETPYSAYRRTSS